MSSVAAGTPNVCHILWVVRDRVTEVENVTQQFPPDLRHLFTESVTDIWSQVQAQAIDLVIFTLADGEILATIERLHNFPIPGVVCLESQNLNLGLACVQAGVQDYLCADEMTPERLERVIRCVHARRAPTSTIQAATVLEQLPLVVFQCDLEGRLTFLNPAWEVLTGLSIDHALGTAISSYLYPGDRAAFQVACQNQGAATNPKSQTCLVRVFGPTGQCRWCEIRLIPWTATAPANQEQPATILGHLYDITKHHLHQQDLQRSEQLWRGYFDSSLVGISIISAENTYVQVNQAFCDLLGYPLPDLIHQHWFDITHPEDLAAELELYQQLCHGEITTYTVDKRFICSNQSTIYVRQSVSGILNSAQEIDQMICTVLDLTDKYAYEAELQASQAFLAHILEGLPDPIFVQDEQHRFVIVNSAFSQLYQQPADQLVGKTVYDLLPTATADLCAARDAMLFQTQEPQTIEEIFTPPNGQTRILLTKLTVFEATQGYKNIVGIMQDVTEQRHQEQELLASKHRLEAAQHIAQLGNWEYNLNTQQVTWSQELFRILAYPPQVYFTYPEHLAPIHPDDLELFRAAVAEAIATQSQCILEYRLQRADGRYCDILGRIQVLATGQSGTKTVVGTVLDITERRQASQELQRTKNRLQFLLRTSPAITFSLQAEPPYTVTFMSENVALFLGYTAADFLDTSEFWWLGIHPDDRNRLTTDLDALQTQNHVRREYRFKHKNGQYCWMQDELRLVQEGENSPEIVGYWTDISARKDAEMALARSQERLQFALEGSGLGLWDWNLALNEVFLSAEWKAMLGYSPEAISSHWQIWERLIHPEDLSLVWQQLQLHLTGERPYFEVEYRLLTQSKSWKWIAARGKVLERDLAGNPWRMTGTHQDIGDRKDIAQMKDEFISVVSHELRTPLTSIHGSLKLLHTGRLGILSDRGQEMLAIAVRNTQRLTQLINDILDLERLESGQLQSDKQWCNAQDLAQQAVETLQAMAHELSVGLELVCQVDFPLDRQSRIWADPLQVVQVLTNLLSNALKFSPSHSTVMLFLSSTATEVLFEIQDDGRGIPSDKLETIFERFQQVDASDTRQKGGTGLGLTICRQIVEQHGGKIWVDSVVGEGSSFYFTIPHTPQDG